MVGVNIARATLKLCHISHTLSTFFPMLNVTLNVLLFVIRSENINYQPGNTAEGLALSNPPLE